MSRIAVVGLGRLGAPLAAVLAFHKHQVIGVDLDSEVVRKVNAGVAPVDETGLQSLMELAHPFLRATTDVAEAVRESALAFVVVPTPSDGAGRFSNAHVVNAVVSLGTQLRETEDWYTIAVVSTVMPGSIRGPISDALEGSSRRSVGIDVSLCYSPAFIALGSVIHDLTHPDTVLVGADDDMAPHAVRAALAAIHENEPTWHTLSSIDAELAKIGLNAAVVTKVSYINMMAEICESIPGANARAVARAIGSDSRIGNKYFQPGAPVGGPCFPRDCVALALAAEDAGCDATIAKAAQEVNDRQVLRLAAKVVDDKRVAILGLTYKTDTDIMEASLGTKLADILHEWEIDVRVHDPAIHADNALTAKECVDWANTVVVATPWPEFAGIDYANKRVIDVWGILPPEDNIERIGESLS